MTGCGKATILAQLIEEVDDLAQSLEIQQRQIGCAWRCGVSWRFAIVRPTHGNGRMGAIGQAEHQVGIDTSADADNVTSLAVKRMMGMGDGHIFQRRLE